MEHCPNLWEAKRLAEGDEAAIVRGLQRMDARTSAPEWGIYSELMVVALRPGISGVEAP